MSWCFAKVNNRLAEIYFNEEKGRLKILGHCYVKKEEYRTKKELKWIEKDTTKFQFKFIQGKYQEV